MAASRLNINLQALTANYRYLGQLSSSATQTGAAVKADAYGLGLGPVSKALYNSGCRQFFVAHLSEGLALRQEIADQICQIFVLEGPQKDEMPDYLAHQLTPVLNSAEQLDRLSSFNQTILNPLSAAVHIDTGMSRLGLDKAGFEALTSSMSSSHPLSVCLVMSHLACADEPAHELNTDQLEKFKQLSAAFKDTKKSLSNSAGILLGQEFHFDLTRPGISLYGTMSDPATVDENLQPVFSWQADILQVRMIEKGETVGYGAEFTATHPTKLATLGVGYADGYARALYRPDQGCVATVGIGGYAAPLAGRVSMDLIVADVSHVPDAVLEEAGHAELIWEGFRLEDMALARHTIAYEVMTGLGGRIIRHYDGPQSGPPLQGRQITQKTKA